MATQATTEVSYGARGLELLDKGVGPQEVIAELLEDDPARERRQLGIVDAQGRTANHTGKECGGYAGHRAGKNYTVQGNLLAGREVIDAVADSFEDSEGSGMELADRLIATLEAGQRAGGDKRTGRKQSAALIVADPRRKHYDGTHITVNIQVAEHPEPVTELRRQYDTIRQRLGHRDFRLVEGRDVIELKRMLHDLGYFRKEANEQAFLALLQDPALRIYDLETAESVDAFRKDQQLPVPGDGLGHDRGIVDADLVRALRWAYAQKRREAAAKPQPAPEPPPSKGKTTPPGQ